MDDYSAPRHRDSINLSVPGSEAYCELVSSTAEKAALLADMEPNAAARARLVAEEVFLHIVDQCRAVKRRDGCRMRFTILPEGLELCFYTTYLAFDPQDIPSYDLSEVLEKEQTCALGLHLVKSFAQRITLTRNGPERNLCLLMAPGVEDGSIRHWSRLVPSLNPGVTITRQEQADQVVHCLKVPSTGKALIASELARHVLGLIDGKTTFDRIMAQTLTAMPHFSRYRVEGLFEDIIANELIRLVELPRLQTEIEVKNETSVKANQAMRVYQQIAGRDSAEQQTAQD